MSNVIERSIRQLGQTIEGQLSLPGDERYLKATFHFSCAAAVMTGRDAPSATVL